MLGGSPFRLLMHGARIGPVNHHPDFGIAQPHRLTHAPPTGRLRRRTPGPQPPFSSRNPTPAPSNARRIAKSFAGVRDGSPSALSARRIVFTPSTASLARSSAVH